jgi:hypothetical protein
MEQAAYEQENKDKQELIYPFPAKPGNGQVNTFIFFFFLIKESEILHCNSKEVKNKIN